jgi:hypothetical protein
MDAARRWVVSAGFGVSLAVVGIPYWMIPYREVSLPDTLLGPALLSVVAAGAAARALQAASWRKAVAIIGAAAPAAVMLRVIVECAIDPTAHNLWPFELAIAAVIGFTCAAAGATLGQLLARASA